MLILHGDARHRWLHGIDAVMTEEYRGDMPALPCQAHAHFHAKAVLPNAPFCGMPCQAHAHVHVGAASPDLLCCGMPAAPHRGCTDANVPTDSVKAKACSCDVKATPCRQLQGHGDVLTGGTLSQWTAATASGPGSVDGRSYSAAAVAAGHACHVGGSCRAAAGGGCLHVVRGTRLSITFRRLQSDVVLTEPCRC